MQQKVSELNKRISILANSKISDGMGGTATTTLTIIPSLWAAIWPVSAKEIINNQAVTMTITHRIRIRYRKVMKPSWIIQYGNRKFNIVGITDPNESHEWLDILAKESA